VAIFLTLFVWLGHEVFVYVQRSLGVIFLVATYHVFTTPAAKAAPLALNAYMATLATLGVAAFAYRSVLGSLLVRRHAYRVKEVNRLDEFVTEIVMDPLEKPLRFTPGQVVYVNFRSLALSEQFHPFEASVRDEVFSIRAGETSNQFHPFSITAAPGDPMLRITVKAVGDYTRALRMLEPGAEAVVEGPYGSFSHRNVQNSKQIWIAGGIGVTPFLSMARSLGGDDEPVVDFYYCVERAEEAHFLDELRAIAASRVDVRVHLIARDEAGLLTAQRVAAGSGDLSYQDVLICGPPVMIENLRSQLVAKGVPPERIHSEEFGFAKLGRTRPGAEVAPAVTGPHSARNGAPRPRTRSRGIAWLAALGFAGLTFAVGIIVGRTTGSTTADRPAAGVTSTTGEEAGSAAAGKTLFASAGCSDCHTLKAAGSHAVVGPNLDDARPDARLVRDVVTNGKGVMPSFEGKLTDQQIRDVAAFVSQTAGH
jgi:predicted ferric reductase/mono/diheme cytochrome c family protein